MNSSTDQTWTQTSGPGYRSGWERSSSTSGSSRDLGSTISDSMTWMTDQMIRWPFWMTTASMQLMMDGMQRLTGTNASSGVSSGNGGTMTDVTSSSRSSQSSSNSSASGSNWVSNLFSGQNDQDLSGNDLKYVVWSIVFTKPGYESLLEPQHEELINYETDASSFAALKIAKFVERARHGKAERPHSWGDRNYPSESSSQARRQGPEMAGNRATESKDKDKESGWRIPAEDQKYIHFLYRVERRLPKQEAEVTRVERVTIERNATSHSSAA
jgi:hypothetical protein